MPHYFGNAAPEGHMTKRIAYAAPWWRRIPRTLHNWWNMRRG